MKTITVSPKGKTCLILESEKEVPFIPTKIQYWKFYKKKGWVRLE